jgi:hypothetical protein
LRPATAASIRWVLTQQRNEGHMGEYVPERPRGDAATTHHHRRRDRPTPPHPAATTGPSSATTSTRVPADPRHDLVALRPGRVPARQSWQAYGPTSRCTRARVPAPRRSRPMDALLGWTIGNAAYARVSRSPVRRPVAGHHRHVERAARLPGRERLHRDAVPRLVHG